MEKHFSENIEELFSALPDDEKRAIISRGSAIRSSSLKKRLFLAQAKLKQFQEKYQISLERLDEDGLPDDADFQMHEDYVMWHHWAEIVSKVHRQLADLEKPTSFGLFSISEEMDVSDGSIS